MVDSKTILVSLDIGELASKCKTNECVEKIISTLKQKQSYISDQEYISLWETNKLIIMILKEVLNNINKQDE